MPRTGVGKERVYAACDALVTRNEAPTLAAVREEVGGTGSRGTIAPLVRNWRAERAAAMKVSGTPVPDEVLHQSSSFTTKIWSVAIAIAEANLASQREAMNQSIALKQKDVDDLQVALEEEELKNLNLVEARKTADAARIAGEARELDAVGKLVEAGAAKGRLEVELTAAMQEAQKAKMLAEGLQAQVHRLESELSLLREKMRKEAS